MRLLVVRDVLEVVVVSLGVTGVDKVLFGKLLECTVVEDVLKMLKSQCKLKDSRIDVGTLLLLQWSGKGTTCPQTADGQVLELHIDKSCWLTLEDVQWEEMFD